MPEQQSREFRPAHEWCIDAITGVLANFDVALGSDGTPVPMDQVFARITGAIDAAAEVPSGDTTARHERLRSEALAIINRTVRRQRDEARALLRETAVQLRLTGMGRDLRGRIERHLAGLED